MKMSFGKRCLFFIQWLLSMACAVAFLGAKIYRPIGTFVNAQIARIPMNLRIPVIIAVAAIYALISLWVLVILFSRLGKRSDRGFIVTESSERGRVRIAISAIEQMVRQAVGTVDGVHDMKITINNRDDAVGIDVNAIINAGAHVPTVTTSMQNAIRQFVELNCGVAVRSVEISVQSVAEGDGKGHKGRKAVTQPVVMPEPEYKPTPIHQEENPQPIEMKFEAEPVSEPSYNNDYTDSPDEEPESSTDD